MSLEQYQLFLDAIIAFLMGAGFYWTRQYTKSVEQRLELQQALTQLQLSKILRMQEQTTEDTGLEC